MLRNAKIHKYLDSNNTKATVGRQIHWGPLNMQKMAQRLLKVKRLCLYLFFIPLHEHCWGGIQCYMDLCAVIPSGSMALFMCLIVKDLRKRQIPISYDWFFAPSPLTALQTRSCSAGASFLLVFLPCLLAFFLGGHCRREEPNSCVSNTVILYGHVCALQAGIFPLA